MTFCPKCSKEMADNAKYCMECGAKIDDNPSSGVNLENNVIQENINGAAATHGSVAVKGNNNLINVVKPESEESIYYQDEIIEDKIINKLKIKLKTVDHIEKISLVLGLISSVITIVGILFDLKNIFPHIILLFFIFMFSGFYFWDMKRTLEKNGEMNFGNRGKKIILDNNKLLITEKVGECLICHNKVYLYYDKSVHELLGKCSKWKKHLYSFDPTIDMGVPVEISTTYYSSEH